MSGSIGLLGPSSAAVAGPVASFAGTFVVSSALALTGAGTLASPWAGWKTEHDAAVTANKAIYFPKGVYDCGSTGLVYSGKNTGFFVYGDGAQTIIRATGSSGAVITVGSQSNTTNSNMDFHVMIRDLCVDGADTMPSGIIVQHAHHGDYANIYILGVTTTGFETKFAVCDTYRSIRVSTLGTHRASPTMPARGFKFGSTASGQTTAATALDCYANGCGYGFDLSSVSTFVMSGGAAEANTNSGLIVGSASGGVTVIGFDMEVNNGTTGTYSVIVNGFNFTLSDSYVEGIIQLNGDGCRVQGIIQCAHIENNGLNNSQDRNLSVITFDGTSPLPTSAVAKSAAQYYLNALAGDECFRAASGKGLVIGNLDNITEGTRIDALGIFHPAQASIPTAQNGRGFRWKNGLWVSNGTDNIRYAKRLTAEDYINQFNPVFATWWGERVGAVLHDAGVNQLGGGTYNGGYTQGQAAVFAENGVTGTTLNGTTGYGQFSYSSTMNVTQFTMISVFKTSMTGVYQQVQDRDPGSGNRPFQWRLNNITGIAEFLADFGSGIGASPLNDTAAANTGAVICLGVTSKAGTVNTATGTGILAYRNGAVTNGGSQTGSLVANTSAAYWLGANAGTSSFFNGQRYFDLLLPVALTDAQMLAAYNLLFYGYKS